MDLLPKIGGVDPYHGGSSQQRPGTGAFARKRKEEEERRKREAADPAMPADLEVDPLLAEIDRLRALDPELTDSGAHRALMALRAYHKSPGEVAPDDDDPFGSIPEAPVVSSDAAATVAERITTRGFVRRAPTPAGTPPAPPTGSDAAGA
jgi:hypothetical protein